MKSAARLPEVKDVWERPCGPWWKGVPEHGLAVSSVGPGMMPKFQFDPSKLLACKEFLALPLAERGLLFTLICECLVNCEFADDAGLAGLMEVHGVPKDEFRKAMTDRVRGFFVQVSK